MPPDADALLGELLRAARHVLRVRADAAPEDEAAAEATELAQGLVDLHESLLRGEALPGAWATAER